MEKETYIQLPPCDNMEVYRDLEKVLSDLCRKEIGISMAIDYIYHSQIKPKLTPPLPPVRIIKK